MDNSLFEEEVSIPFPRVKSENWEYKYAAEYLNQLILPDDYMRFFTKLIKGEFSHLLLYSPTPGTGKTTTSKVLCNELNAEAKFLSATTEMNMEALRTTILQFATSSADNGRQKIVIIDECDRLNPQVQESLKTFTEKYASNCKFIFTCNNIGGIVAPLREGRTRTFDYNMNKPEYRKELIPKIIYFMKCILECEGVEYTEEAVEQIVEKYFPSIRTTLSVLEKAAGMYSKIDERALSAVLNMEALLPLLVEHKLTDAHKFIMDSGCDSAVIFRTLFDNATTHFIQKSRAIVTIAEYEFRCASGVVQPDIQIKACLCELLECEPY